MRGSAEAAACLEQVLGASILQTGTEADLILPATLTGSRMVDGAQGFGQGAALPGVEAQRQ